MSTIVLTVDVNNSPNRFLLTKMLKFDKRLILTAAGEENENIKSLSHTLFTNQPGNNFVKRVLSPMRRTMATFSGMISLR